MTEADHSIDTFCSFEDREGVLVIRVLKPLTKQAIFRITDEVAAHGCPSKRLWLVGHYLSLSAEEMVEVGEYAKATVTGVSKVAYVTDDDLAFGLTNIHAAYRDNPAYDYRIFRDEASAMVWLSEY